MGFSSWLVAITAEQAGVLVGLEVRHAYDHRMRRKRRRKCRYSLSHPADEEVTWRLVRGSGLTDLAPERLVELGQFQQRLRMDADLIVDDELQPRQSDSGIRQPRECEGLIRGSDVHHDLDADLGHVPLLGLLDGEVEQASVHIAGVTLSTRDGHRLPVLQLAGRRT
jgi:hypothetical protein